MTLGVHIVRLLWENLLDIERVERTAFVEESKSCTPGFLVVKDDQL